MSGHSEALDNGDAGPRTILILLEPRRYRERVLRRAWGVYYAIWSAATICFLGVAAAALRFSSVHDHPALALFEDLFIGIVAGLVTLRYFRGVWQETHFPLWKVGRGFIVSFLLFVVGLTSIGIYPSTGSFFLLGGILFTDSAILWWQLKWSLGRLPAEGIMAVGALILSSLGSVAVLLFTGNVSYYGLMWLVTVIAWSCCAVYAFIYTDNLPPPAASKESS